MDLARRDDSGFLVRCDDRSLPSLFCLGLTASDRFALSRRFRPECALGVFVVLALLSDGAEEGIDNGVDGRLRSTASAVSLLGVDGGDFDGGILRVSTCPSSEMERASAAEVDVVDVVDAVAVVSAARKTGMDDRRTVRSATVLGEVGSAYSLLSVRALSAVAMFEMSPLASSSE
jgi:hypothetical protein